MAAVEQGDLLRVGGLKYPVIVVSNNFFNQSGKAVVCPIGPAAAPGPLHIPLPEDCPARGWVLCEQVKYVDLNARRYSRFGAISLYDTMDISDAVMGMFDYQKH